jgi:hypothetical protein
MDLVGLFYFLDGLFLSSVVCGVFAGEGPPLAFRLLAPGGT